MKVLILNGSPRTEGNTAIALNEVARTLNGEGIETITLNIGKENIRGCLACNWCREHGKCVIDDKTNEVAQLFEQADGLVIGSPVYYASANGTLISLLDRIFHGTKFDKTMKVGASVAVARRGGCSSTFDQLNKYFTISGMPVASSQYWNQVHGLVPGDALKDEEGLQTMRTLARNMAFLIKSIALGKEKYGLPQKEDPVSTHFIR
jgi:multimeric flavodoxin WrbA